MTVAPPRSLLILGGTSWLGGAVARLALQRGHRVTCLARGRSGTVPPGAEHVVADRWLAGAYGEVADRAWDTVLDVSWQPELVRGAASALAGRTEHWLYVSSASAYADRRPDSDESAPVHEPWRGSGEVTVEQYGPAKVACEQAVRSVAGERSCVCRPGLIAGYGDLSDRFGYWPARMGRIAVAGEPVLVPRLDGAVQVIDVDDLARWLVHVIEHQVTGVYNAVGDVHTMADVLDACGDLAAARPALVPVTDDWLLDRGVAPWSGDESLPLWLPAEYAGDMTRRNDAARAAGLDIRPLRATVAAALTWERELGLERPRRAGLTPAREVELLAAARAQV
jgi:nucleoside-diphosphate-sugar epimerase